MQTSADDLPICPQDCSIDTDKLGDENEIPFLIREKEPDEFVLAKRKTRKASFVELIDKLDQSDRSKGINDSEWPSLLTSTELSKMYTGTENGSHYVVEDKHLEILTSMEKISDGTKNLGDNKFKDTNSSCGEVIGNGVTNLDSCEDGTTLARFSPGERFTHPMQLTSEYCSVSSDFSSLNTTSSVFSSVFGGSSNQCEYKRGLSIQSDGGVNESLDHTATATIDEKGEEKGSIDQSESPKVSMPTSSDSDHIEVTTKSSSNTKLYFWNQQICIIHYEKKKDLKTLYFPKIIDSHS